MNDDLMRKAQIACFTIEILDSRLNNVSLFRLLLLLPSDGGFLRRSGRTYCLLLCRVARACRYHKDTTAVDGTKSRT